MRDDRVYLRHIRDAIDSILEYTAGGRAQFSRNKMMQDAVVRNLEIIGEAVDRRGGVGTNNRITETRRIIVK